MLAFILALTLPVLQIPTQQAQTRALSTRWHSTTVIESGLPKLAFIAICPDFADTAGSFFAVDSSGQIEELRFRDRTWQIGQKFAVGERVVTGCAAAMRPDQIWSLIIGTASGKIVEMRPGMMGWAKFEVATMAPPIRAIASSVPGNPGPSQIVVIDGTGEATNWYVGGSGRWIRSPLPNVDGGATHVCFDQRGRSLNAIVTGPKGIIYKFEQDSLGAWSGAAWDTMSAGCRDLAPSADPTMKDICIFYSGTDGHLRYLFSGRMDDVTARLPCAAGADHLIGKGDQRRFNEFFGMLGGEFCLFEYNGDLADWIKVPIRAIRGDVVSTVFGPARGRTWHTIYAATADGKIYEFERDGLESE